MLSFEQFSFRRDIPGPFKRSATMGTGDHPQQGALLHKPQYRDYPLGPPPNAGVGRLPPPTERSPLLCLPDRLETARHTEEAVPRHGHNQCSL